MNDRARHARTDETILRRIGELTKREIQVYLYLRLCRNSKTGRCNPSRSLIAAGTGVFLPGVTLAIAGLDSKGWIRSDPNSGFEIVPIEDVPELVTKLITTPDPKTYQIDNPANYQIDNPTYQIDNPTYQIDNSPLKELNKQRTDKEQLTDPSDPVEATATDRDKTAIWTEGVRLLTAGGMTEKHARTLLGKLAKGSSERTLAEAIGAAMYKNPADPQSFLVAAVNVRVKSVSSAAVGRSSVPGPPPVVAEFVPRPPPAIPPEAAAAWNRLRREIAARVPVDVMVHWFDRILFDGCDGFKFKLRADSVTVDWVQRLYMPAIGEALAAADLELFSIDWEIEDAKTCKTGT